MDQLSSIGVEFDEKSLDRLFKKQRHHYETLTPAKNAKPFAVDAIHIPNRPFRPWALGAINKASNPLYVLAGNRARTPGLYRQVECKTHAQKAEFLHDTNEKIHASVRVRLLCKGLGLDDCAVWEAEALKKWKLKRNKESSKSVDEDNKQVDTWGPPLEEQEDVPDAGHWSWVYIGKENEAPPTRIMLEERLGPYERYFLKLSGGSPNAYHFASTCEHE